jgi:RHS repeat-associated protein
VHSDYLGSIRTLTDDNANVTDTYTYDAFGELLNHTGNDPQPYAFAGEPFDQNTGLSYNRARWYDPSAGRFSSMDVASADALRPVTSHKYLYSAASPLNFTDPTGLFLEGAMATVGMVEVLSSMAQLLTSSVIRQASSRTITLRPIRVEEPYWELPSMGGPVGLGPTVRPFCMWTSCTPSWSEADAAELLADTREIWGAHGIDVNWTPDGGAISRKPASFMDWGEAAEVVRSATGRTSPFGREIPVLLGRGSGEYYAASNNGITFSGSDDVWFTTAIIAVSKETHVRSTLAHELGHALTLTMDNSDPTNLMYKAGNRTNTLLTPRQEGKALDALAHR